MSRAPDDKECAHCGAAVANIPGNRRDGMFVTCDACRVGGKTGHRVDPSPPPPSITTAELNRWQTLADYCAELSGKRARERDEARKALDDLRARLTAKVAEWKVWEPAPPVQREKWQREDCAAKDVHNECADELDEIIERSEGR